MLALTTKGRYGTRLMLQLARGYGKEPMLLRTIADREDISQGYLEQILPMLKAAKLICATRGAHGGYCLVRSPHKITMREVIEALEGPIAVVECVNYSAVCSRHKKCIARNVWCKLKESIVQTLEGLTLGDLVKPNKKSKN